MFFDRELLRTVLSKTIGFYQTSNSNYPTLSPSLISSKYDRYVNEVHGLITTENIHQSIKNFSRYTFPQWEGAPYDAEDYVTDNGINYECVQNAPIGTLLTDTAFWFQLDDFNNYLIQKRFQAVDRAIDSVINDKKTRKRIKSIYSNVLLYDNIANYRDKQANESNFVGLRFIMKSDRSLITLINKIGHQFSEAVSIPLYLYHSSQQTPLAVFNLSHTKPLSSQWTTLTQDNVLRYLSDDYDAGGAFFLGYAQSDLGTAQALNMYQLDWYNGFNCSTCSGRSYEYYSNYSQYIDVMAFSVPESSFTVGTDLFQLDEVTLYPTRNYGLNINMTNQCDLTPFIIDEDRLMAEAINNVAGLEVLKDMSSNTRGSNNVANQVKIEAGKQIVSFDGVRGTVLDITNSSLKGLSFDLSNLNDDCLSCEDPTMSDGNSEYRIVYNDQ